MVISRGQIVKAQKDTLLYTYATVNECCSYKYQKTARKGVWGTGAGPEKKAAFIQPYILNTIHT